jgi:HEAT repeat protein
VRRRSLEAIERAADALGVLIDRSAGAAPVTDDREALLPLAAALRDQGPRLVRALGDPSPPVRLAAHRVLQAVATSRSRLPAGAADPLLEPLAAALPVLVAQTAHPDRRTRRAALEVLEALGPTAAPAAPALLRSLADGDVYVRWAAARLLGRLRLTADGAVPELARLLGDASPDVRLAAAAALARYGPAAAPALPALCHASAAGDVELRLAALRALQGVVADDARPVLPVLHNALADPEESVRQLAATVLDELSTAPASKRPAP